MESWINIFMGKLSLYQNDYKEINHNDILIQKGEMETHITINLNKNIFKIKMKCEEGYRLQFFLKTNNIPIGYMWIPIRKIKFIEFLLIKLHKSHWDLNN